MSWNPTQNPECPLSDSADIETLIIPRAHDLGGFEVRHVRGEDPRTPLPDGREGQGSPVGGEPRVRVIGGRLIDAARPRQPPHQPGSVSNDRCGPTTSSDHDRSGGMVCWRRENFVHSCFRLDVRGAFRQSREAGIDTESSASVNP